MEPLVAQLLPEANLLDIKLARHAVYPSEMMGIRQANMLFALSLRNYSDQSLRLLGKKWTIIRNGTTHILEQENLFNQHPLLKPNEIFAYASTFFLPHAPQKISVSFFGRNQAGIPFLTKEFTFPKLTF